jgi:aspartate kinase
MTPRVLVQKFGGTSVATPERRRQVMSHVRRAREEGFDVAIVVSAMGRRGDPYATDTLLDLLRADGPVELADHDLIFACGEAISAAVISHLLNRSGIPASGMTAAQAGVYTDEHHGEAEIESIDTRRLLDAMAAGRVPVVTGAQGIGSASGEFTTLGRGGSDTSGVAVGVALQAVKVEIFTDVTGVATVDPRLEPSAAIRRQVSYPAMYELARFGASVVHPRAIKTGWHGKTPIVVRSTFSDDPGTLIADLPDEEPIVGIATLSRLETIVLPATRRDDLRLQDLERVGVMSFHDAERQRLIVGAPPEQALTVRRALSDASMAEFADEARMCGWVSVVGERGVLPQARGVARAAMEELSIEWVADVIEGRRLTFVVPEEARAQAITAVHAKLFEPS